MSLDDLEIKKQFSTGFNISSAQFVLGPGSLTRCGGLKVLDELFVGIFFIGPPSQHILESLLL